MEDGARLGHRRSCAPARHGVGGRARRHDGREVRPHGWVLSPAQRLRDHADARGVHRHAVLQRHAGHQARASEDRDVRLSSISRKSIDNLSVSVDFVLRDHRGQHPAGWGPDGRHGLLPAKRPVPVLADHAWRHRRASRIPRSTTFRSSACPTTTRRASRPRVSITRSTTARTSTGSAAASRSACASWAAFSTSAPTSMPRV